jgi:hypothetical protein
VQRLAPLVAEVAEVTEGAGAPWVRAGARRHRGGGSASVVSRAHWFTVPATHARFARKTP